MEYLILRIIDHLPVFIAVMVDKFSRFALFLYDFRRHFLGIKRPKCHRSEPGIALDEGIAVAPYHRMVLHALFPGKSVHE